MFQLKRTKVLLLLVPGTLVVTWIAAGSAGSGCYLTKPVAATATSKQMVASVDPQNSMAI